jgi:hypothetical protein
VRFWPIIATLFGQGHLAFALQPFLVGATLSPSCALVGARRKDSKMIKLLREVLLIAMLGVVSVGAFAQRRDQDKDKRPPKEPVKVITNDRKDQRPPQNNNQQRPKGDNRRRP